MPLFKRKEQNLIPPVSAPTPTTNSSQHPSQYPGSYRSSSSSTYVASRDGDPYSALRPSLMSRSSSQTTGNPPEDNTYSTQKNPRNQRGLDVYTRGEANLEQDRSELFAGYKPQKPGAGSGRFFDGPDMRPSANPGEETEEDVEGIKQQTRFVKQESVNSTRNALRMAREAEETARNTLSRLGDQSEKLANTERHLDVSKGYSLRAEDKADELKKLNRSIFIPVVTFNKDAKRAAQEAKVQARYDEEREEKEKAMMDVRNTQNRVGKATTYGRNDDGEEVGGGRRMLTGTEKNTRLEQRKRFQFEATASDDEMEDELDDNLNEISDVTKRLKALGKTMGQELDEQMVRINRIDDKAEGLDRRVFANTEKLKRIK